MGTGSGQETRTVTRPEPERHPALTGMKAIMDHCCRIGLHHSEKKIRELKDGYGFPMRKLLGNWVSDTRLIDEWRKRYIASADQASLDTPGGKIRDSESSSQGKG